jgi:hypothetical protein
MGRMEVPETTKSKNTKGHAKEQEKVKRPETRDEFRRFG